MASSAIENLLDARFMTTAYHQRTNSSVPTNPLLENFDRVREQVFGDTIEIKIFPTTNEPAPTNNYGGQAKVLDKTGGNKIYITPIHSFNEMPINVAACMYLEMEDNPMVQALGKQEVDRQLAGFKIRNNLLRTVVLAKTLFGGPVYRNSSGQITETSSTGPTIDLQWNSTTNGGQIARSNFSNFQGGSGNVIDASWATASTKILTQLDDLRELAEHTGQEVPTDIWCHPTMKRYLRDNTEIKSWVQYNSKERADVILKGDVWNDIGGYTWHFYGGTYRGSNGTTYTMFPRDKVAITPPVEQGGWFRAIDAAFPVPTQSGILATGVEPTANLSGANQIVYGDFVYLKQDDNPSIYKIRGGTTFLYAFANPSCLWVPTVTGF